MPFSLIVQVQKSPEALAIYAACLQTGVIFLPLNTAYTAREMAYFIENSGAKLVLCDAKAETALHPVAQAAQAQLQVLNGDGSGGFTRLAMHHVVQVDASQVRSEAVVQQPVVQQPVVQS